MSEKENEFLKKVKRTYQILLPTVVTLIVAASGIIISDHFKIRANDKMIKSNNELVISFKDSYVSNTMMVRYLEETRLANIALVKAFDETKELNIEEHQIINKRIDDMLKEAYKSRGVSAFNPNNLE